MYLLAEKEINFSELADQLEQLIQNDMWKASGYIEKYGKEAQELEQDLKQIKENLEKIRRIV